MKITHNFKHRHRHLSMSAPDEWAKAAAAASGSDLEDGDEEHHVLADDMAEVIAVGPDDGGLQLCTCRSKQRAM